MGTTCERRSEMTIGCWLYISPSLFFFLFFFTDVDRSSESSMYHSKCFPEYQALFLQTIALTTFPSPFFFIFKPKSKNKKPVNVSILLFLIPLVWILPLNVFLTLTSESLNLIQKDRFISKMFLRGDSVVLGELSFHRRYNFRSGFPWFI